MKRGQSKYMPHLRKAAAAPRRRLLDEVIFVDDAYTTKAVAKPAALKGIEGKNCNRTACQKPGAWWKGRYEGYYCEDCARAINKSCLSTDFLNLGVDPQPLVTPPQDVEIIYALQEEIKDPKAPYGIRYANDKIDYFATEHEAIAAQALYRYQAGIRSDGKISSWYTRLLNDMAIRKAELDKAAA